MQVLVEVLLIIWDILFVEEEFLMSIEEDKGQYNDAAEVFWATGACLFIRAATCFNEDEWFR